MPLKRCLITSTSEVLTMLVVVMKICWISAGVSSFVAGYLVKESVDEFIYTHIDDQHEDSMRFIKDCEKVLGKEIKILRSEYKNVESVIRQFRYINGPHFAPCTNVLKKRVRKEYEYKLKESGITDITYVWGFDSSKRERARAERTLESMPQFKHEFPLIDNNLTKEDAHGILKKLGIQRPKMYDMGYRNNNCIGCVKGGMGYWNKIRIDFPEVFQSRAKLEREIGHSCLKNTFLDELDPSRGRIEDEVMEDCSIMCQLIK